MNQDREKTGGLISKHEAITITQKNPNTGAIIREYTRGKMIGKGGFAKCYELATENTKKQAVKVIEKASLTRSKAREKLNSEIKIHRSLKSSHVVGFNHFFEDDHHVYIILELCSNQTLNELIKRRKRITQIEAKYYLHQIAMGVKDLHQNRVIHRDLKLGNLFLNDKLEIKIGDFGLAARLSYDAERRKTMCGTPNYIAPEILQSNSDNNGHSYEVDIWSLGVIAYAFVVGRPPFQTNDVRATYSKIKSCNYSFPDGIPLSRTVRKFISKMLIRDPSRRATIDQVLNDDFFTQTPFPKTLPISLLACPPNSAFIRQYSENNEIKNSSEIVSQVTTRGVSQRKYSKGIDSLNTERVQDKERESLGRVLVRASSIDRMDKKNQVVQRACSTAALMVPKRNTSSHESQNIRNHGQGPHIWVMYSEENPKFGVCYMLNSQATGMKFNDSTYIISNNNFTRVKYYPNSQDRISMGGTGEVYEIMHTPETMAKKMKIISYYQKELKNRKESEENTITNQERITREKLRFRETSETAMNVFVVRHYKTTKVSIFWFNNKDYQVLFKDCTELLVAKDHYITYVNKLAERKYFQITELEEQPEEIKKRMNHVLTLIKKIKDSSTQRNAQNINDENRRPLTRSSSTIKVDKSLPKQPTIMRGSASMTRLAPYKFIK